MPATPAQAAAIRAIALAITDALKEAGSAGIPSGHLYALLMGFGCTLEQFEKFMGTLVKIGAARKQGLLYFAV